MKNILPPIRKRRLRGGGTWGLGTLTTVCYPSEMSSQRKGEQSVKPPKSLTIRVFNVRRCSSNEVKKGDVSRIFLRWRSDVCALSVTKLKGKCEVLFGEVVGRVSGLEEGGRGRGGPVTGWVVAEFDYESESV